MMFLFVNETFTSLNTTIQCFKQTTSWRLPKKIILVINHNVSQKEIESLFLFVWKLKIVNIVIVAKINEEIIYAGFNPYLGQYFQNLTVGNLFHNKFSNMNGQMVNVFLVKREVFTKIRVYQVENETFYGGKDAMTIQSILLHLNASLNVVDLHKLYDLDNPWRPQNKYTKEHLKQPLLHKHDADLFFDSMIMEINKHTDLIYPHSRDDFCVLLPKAKHLSHYKHLSRLIKDGFYIFLIFFIICCPVVWFVLTICENRILAIKNKFSNIAIFSHIFLNNLRNCLGFSMHVIRINTSYNNLLMWLCFCNLIVNNYFQSILTSILVKTDKEPDINTIKELAESEYVILSPQILIDLAVASLKALGKPIPKFELASPRMFEVTYKKVDANTTVLLERDRLEASIKLCPIFHIVKEALIPNYFCFHVVRGSPYVEVMELYVPRIIEAGLYDFWKWQSAHAVYLKDGMCDAYFLQGEERDENFVVLSLYLLRGAFYLLFIGWSLAFFVFVIEIFIGVIKKQKCAHVR